MRAWYQGTLSELVASEARPIAAELARASLARNLAGTRESLDAWTGTVVMLQRAARELIEGEPSASEWHYFLEFEIPRRGRRIDAVVLSPQVIFLIEWKVGAVHFDRAAIWQAEQYALDMRDFHEGSRDRPVVPMLVATRAAEAPPTEGVDSHRLVQPVQLVTPAEIAPVLRHASSALDGAEARSPIDPVVWENSEYRPIPSIIEAARMLYEGNDVREISLAGAHNLGDTVDAVLELVNRCQREGRRGIAFVTGAPGSGKTLAGLRAVHSETLLRHGEGNSVFLSGNLPLVEVMRAALAASARRAGLTKGEAERQVRTLIGHAYQFRNEHIRHPDAIPSEHVIVFDEAQRAWNATRVESFTKGEFARSEPEMFLRVMESKPDWAVVVALVGSGQEINSGEAGIAEWGHALSRTAQDWLIWASPPVVGGETPLPGGRLFDTVPEPPVVMLDERLHLLMNVRSPRAERLNQWVDALLMGDTIAARSALPDPVEYPMVMTRSLPATREWLRDHRDVDHRTGLIASANAQRLRAWGLDTKALQREGKWADWFLRDPGDVRGSDQLETVATNFDCQGLEIEWAGVCWGNDLVPTEAGWRARSFRGAAWQRANEEKARYILNGYRVILTRARRGQIIWVPQPDGRDPTLPPAEFDAIAAVLQAAGVPSID